MLNNVPLDICVTHLDHHQSKNNQYAQTIKKLSSYFLNFCVVAKKKQQHDFCDKNHHIVFSKHNMMKKKMM